MSPSTGGATQRSWQPGARGRTPTASAALTRAVAWRRRAGRFTYGRLSARIKVPAGKGLWPSFWTTGNGSWLDGGEIDVMESLGHQRRTTYCSVHGADTAGDQVSATRRHNAPAPLTGGFHIYAARWTATGVTFTVDGRPCGAVSTAAMKPFSPQQIRVGMTVGGSWPGAPDSRTAFPATMLIDWVKVDR